VVHYYADCTSEEIENTLKNQTLLLPVGAIEQHGPHLPLSVDIDIATALAIELSARHKGLVAPGISYAARSQPHSGGGPSFPGTIYVRGHVLIEYFVDVFKSYIRAGAIKILVLNGHFENEPFLFEALEICRENDFFTNTSIIGLSWWSVVSKPFCDTLFQGEFPGWHAEHASTAETSLMLYLKPELVRDIRVDHDSPPLEGIYFHPIQPEKISTRGVLAKTSSASKEMGEKLFCHICDQIESIYFSQAR
jgi:creatinine amidohydrolase